MARDRMHCMTEEGSFNSLIIASSFPMEINSKLVGRDNQGINSVSPCLLLLNEIIKIFPLKYSVPAKKFLRQQFHLMLGSKQTHRDLLSSYYVQNWGCRAQCGELCPESTNSGLPGHSAQHTFTHF